MLWGLLVAVSRLAAQVEPHASAPSHPINVSEPADMDIVRCIARILIATWLGIFLGAEVFLGHRSAVHPGLIAMYLLLFLIADELQARWSLSQRHVFVLA